MSNIDEPAAGAANAADQARQLSTGINQFKDALDSLATAFAAIGANDKQTETKACAAEAEALTAHVNSLADSLEALRSRIDALRGLLPASASGTPPPQPRSPSFDHAARDNARSTALRGFGWPKNSKGRTSARGLLYDSEGNAALRQPLRALRKGKVYNAPELKEPWRSDPEMKTTWHIEGGAAAYMRKTQTRVMSLWLNVPACGGYDRPDPQGCAENLPKVLPRGYTLHVHVEEEHGGFRYTEYRGTGEALR